MLLRVCSDVLEVPRCVVLLWRVLRCESWGCVCMTSCVLLRDVDCVVHAALYCAVLCCVVLCSAALCCVVL